ncbi:MAG: tyrosine-type recombinase/integrase, partial [Acidobacteriota bacterium]
FHSLRHTYASYHVMAGTHLYAVSQLLNHKTLSIVKRYAHLSPDFRKQVTDKTAQISQGWLSLLKDHQDSTAIGKGTK